jgi:hypothetical protein
MAQQYSKGLAFDDAAYAKQPIKAALTRSLVFNLPSKASLRQYAPTPKTQGQYGTCTSWSTAYAAFSIIENQKAGITNQTAKDANTFSPPFIYRSISDDYSCATGTYIHLALETMKNHGVPPFSAYNVMCADATIPQDLFTKASGYKIKDYARLFSLEHDNSFKIQATKKSLSEGKPVVIGMMVPESFYTVKGLWNPTEDPNQEYGGHAMCVIGYNDDQDGGVFEVMNSWGTTWGENGFFTVRYEDYANFTKYGYEIFEMPKEEPENFDLSGAVKLILSTGVEMSVRYDGSQYVNRKPYSSGTNFRIMISNNEPAYVYAFGTDATRSTFQIFPHERYVSAALTYKKNDVAIPDEEHFIQMDETVGQDYLFVLYSNKSLDLDMVRRRFEQAQGSIQQKLQIALGSDMVNPSNVEFIEGTMKFRAKSGGRSVVVLTVLTEHIN